MTLKFFLWSDFVSLPITLSNFFKYMYKGNDDFWFEYFDHVKILCLEPEESEKVEPPIQNTEQVRKM